MSFEHFLMLLDTFADCAQVAYNKLKQLDEVHAMLPGGDEIGLWKVLGRSRRSSRHRRPSPSPSREVADHRRSCFFWG